MKARRLAEMKESRKEEVRFKKGCGNRGKRLEEELSALSAQVRMQNQGIKNRGQRKRL
jgi:hypothetical protein